MRLFMAPRNIEAPKPVTSWFSTGGIDDRSRIINDKLEKKLVHTELVLDAWGKIPVASGCSGVVRIIFGACEVIGSVVFPIFRLLFSAPYFALRYGRGQALLACAEAAIAMTYTKHGLANISRGVAEIFQMGTGLCHERSSLFDIFSLENWDRMKYKVQERDADLREPLLLNLEEPFRPVIGQDSNNPEHIFLIRGNL
jgi:hypothetical protein